MGGSESALLSADMLAMVASGVSTIVSSCDAALRPSVMRAVGSTIAANGRCVTVYLARRQSRQLLLDIAASGYLAVVFSQPSTNCALQLKARHASSRTLTTDDHKVLERYLAAMEVEISQVGFAPPLTRAMLAHSLEDVVAIEFEPEEAFDQTPGPNAGASLCAGQRGAAV